MLENFIKVSVRELEVHPDVKKIPFDKELGLVKLDYVVLTLSDKEVVNTRIRINQKLKVNLIETCYQVEYILGIHEVSQGNKNEFQLIQTLKSNLS